MILDYLQLKNKCKKNDNCEKKGDFETKSNFGK